jgi:succinate--hydroxymethylglutarate CoA-transferase
VTSPSLGPIGILRNAVTMADGPATVRTATPGAGEHTDTVLAELGLGDAEIEDLRRRGVVS